MRDGPLGCTSRGSGAIARIAFVRRARLRPRHDVLFLFAWKPDIHLPLSESRP